MEKILDIDVKVDRLLLQGYGYVSQKKLFELWLILQTHGRQFQNECECLLGSSWTISHATGDIQWGYHEVWTRSRELAVLAAGSGRSKKHNTLLELRADSILEVHQRRRCCDAKGGPKVPEAAIYYDLKSKPKELLAEAYHASDVGHRRRSWCNFCKATDSDQYSNSQMIIKTIVIIE